MGIMGLPACLVAWIGPGSAPSPERQRAADLDVTLHGHIGPGAHLPGQAPPWGVDRRARLERHGKNEGEGVRRAQLAAVGELRAGMDDLLAEVAAVLAQADGHLQLSVLASLGHDHAAAELAPRRHRPIELQEEPHGSTHTAAGEEHLPRLSPTTVHASISHANETTSPSWE